MPTITTDLTNSQIAAIDRVLEELKSRQYAILSGYAGTGKTYTALRLARAFGGNYMGVAFTGAAANNLGVAGFENTSTIHRLIYKPVFSNGIVVRYELRPQQDLVDLDLLIVDEYSMIEEGLLCDLLGFGIKCVFLGDPFQLPPIGKPNRLLGEPPTALLSEIIRQDNNELLAAITRVRETLELPKPHYGTAFGCFKEPIPNAWLDSTKQITVLCGRNSTRTAVNAAAYGRTTPAVGDKLVVLQNNYGVGVFNGQDLEITSEPRKTYFGWVAATRDINTGEVFQKMGFVLGNPFPRAPRNLVFADFGFCKTVHKAQGLTLPRVVVLNEWEIMGADKVLRARWLYTALSRAKTRAALFIGGRYIS